MRMHACGTLCSACAAPQPAQPAPGSMSLCNPACPTPQAPVACAIGGGYQADHSCIVERHVLLHQAAAELMPQLAAAGRAAAAGQRRR